MTKNKKDLMEKIKNTSANVVVLGLGYVGLPLTVVLAEAGYHVTGVDPDQNKVDQLNQGVSYIDDIETKRLDKLVNKKSIQATCDFSVVSDAE